MAATYGDLRHLLPGNYKRLITEWLEEDCPSYDYGGFVVGETEGEARLLGKSKVSSFFTDSTRSRYAWMRPDICRESSLASRSSTKSSHNSDART